MYAIAAVIYYYYCVYIWQCITINISLLMHFMVWTFTSILLPTKKVLHAMPCLQWAYRLQYHTVDILNATSCLGFTWAGSAWTVCCILSWICQSQGITTIQSLQNTSLGVSDLDKLLFQETEWCSWCLVWNSEWCHLSQLGQTLTQTGPFVFQVHVYFNLHVLSKDTQKQGRTILGSVKLNQSIIYKDQEYNNAQMQTTVYSCRESWWHDPFCLV